MSSPVRVRTERSGCVASDRHFGGLILALRMMRSLIFELTARHFRDPPVSVRPCTSASRWVMMSFAIRRP